MKNNKKINPRMKELQSEMTELALEIGRYYGIDLDFSTESIKEVEKILSSISTEHRKTKNMEGIDGIALELAAYIVTVIEKNILMGSWKRNSPEFGIDTFPYDLGEGNLIFPYIWCKKRIYDGKEENVWSKFQALVLKNRQN